MTFIEDGNTDIIEHNGKKLIHFMKYRRLAVVIRDIQQYQQKSYNFDIEDTIREYLEQLDHLTDDGLFKISLELEPREVRDTVEF